MTGHNNIIVTQMVNLNGNSLGDHTKATIMSPGEIVK